jgi:hypothetical protein
MGCRRPILASRRVQGLDHPTRLLASRKQGPLQLGDSGMHALGEKRPGPFGKLGRSQQERLDKARRRRVERTSPLLPELGKELGGLGPSAMLRSRHGA